MTECRAAGVARPHTAEPMNRPKPRRAAMTPGRPSAALPALLLALVIGAGATPVAQAASPPADYAERVLASLNAYRQARGLPALQPSSALSRLAAEHSGAMASLRRPSHDGFAARFERSGAELCVENVAHGYTVPEQVIGGWRRVATHHRNLLEPRVTTVGVANQGLFVTFFACGG